MNAVDPIKSLDDIRKMKEFLARKPRNALLFSFGINSGLRISDILKLKVRDVRNKHHIEIKEQKTSKYKKFLITDSYKIPLQEYILDKKDHEWLFPSQRGDRPITRVQAYRIISKACEKAGIKARIGTHTLRKTFGYHCYQKYDDVVLLQKIFNHSSPQITLRYIGIEQEDIDAVYRDFYL